MNSKRIFSILKDTLAISILFGFFLPILLWYYNRFPPIGTDFYQFTAYVQYFKEHFTLPVLSWKYIWFDGLPTFTDYAWLFFYLGVPFAKIWGLVIGAKIYLMLILFLYGIFSYFLLKELSKSRFFAIGGSIALLWTLNLYDALMGGGNTTYSSTQIFLPLGLLFLVKYYKNFNRKYLYLLILTAGISYMGHAGTSLLFIWTPLLIIFALWVDDKVKLFSFKKMKESLYFGFFSLGIGFFALYSVAYLVLTIPKLAGFSLSGEIERVHPPAIVGLFATQNIFLYAAFLLLLFLVIFHRSFKGLKKMIPFIGVSIYMLFFEWLYVIGKNPFGGSLFPSRTYWVFGLLLACMTAILYKIWNDQWQKQTINFFKKTTILIVKVILLLVLFSTIINSYVGSNEKIFGITQDTIGVGLNLREYYFPALTTLGVGTNDKSVDKLIAKRNITEQDKSDLKDKLIPNWLDTNEMNYRLHTLRVGINTWWNSLFKKPIAHGAYSSRLLNTQNYAYWTDVAMHGELVANYDTPLEIAKNNLLFLLDWRAINSLYGQDLEIKEDTSYDQDVTKWALGIATYITKDENIVDRKGNRDIPIEELPEEEKNFDNLTFFRVRKEATSPIIKTTNAPTILVMSDLNGYDNFLRNLAAVNLNSRYIIPVEGPKSLGDFSLEELKNFDIVLLYRYKSGRKDWQKLEKYVKEGGKLFIETNDDIVKESDSKEFLKGESLPTVFPISETEREGLGKEWEEEIGDSEIFEDIDFEKFDPLDYDGDPWKLSYTNEEKVRDWGEVLLSQDEHPILVSGELGQGKVIWSGMSLFYHISRYNNLEEAQLLENILKSFVGLKDEGTLDFKMERPKPELVSVEGEDFTGVVFKENNYGGWKAKIISPEKKSLKVYKAGLGYSYVAIPSDVNFPAKVKFYYVGSLRNWLMFLLSTVLIIHFTILLIFKKKLFSINRFKIGRKYTSKMKDWWDKDEDY